MRRSLRRLRAAADRERYTANLTMVSTYSSKIDVWLAAVVTLGAIVAAAVAPIPGKWAIVLPILLIGVALPAWIFLATRYTLTQTDLLVRSGPFRWLVPLRAIDRVVPTRCPLSSPALSLDRLRIDYGGGRSIMISPRARETFLQDLHRRRSDNML
jgi:hypothetical protein